MCTLDPQLFLLFWKAMEALEGIISLEEMDQEGRALRFYSSAVFPAHALLP